MHCMCLVQASFGVLTFLEAIMFFVINTQNVVELLMHGRCLTNMCVV